MDIKLSNRMDHIARMVTPGLKVVDIGCDHGFVSAFLIQSCKAQHVIAADVAEGPLSIARENISKMGLGDRIELRLSDGFDALEGGETDGAIIAGMGGQLIIRIIKNGIEKLTDGYEFVLSPQSEVFLVREFLRENHISIIDEDMVFEEGKYYNIIKATLHKKQSDDKKMDESFTLYEVDEDENETEIDKDLDKIYILFGKHLIRKKSPVLRRFLEQEIEKKQGIYCRLSKNSSQSVVNRLSEIDREIFLMGKTLNMLTE